MILFRIKVNNLIHKLLTFVKDEIPYNFKLKINIITHL